MPPYSYFTNKTLGNLTYYIYDHLGNTRVTYKPNVSCSNGAVSYTLESVLDYYPYSKLLREFRAGVAEKYQSTGNERDIETGWDFRNRRNSDADIGRFLQIDPKFELNPQWSSYVYTNDNPALLIDPNGDCPPGTPCWQFQQGVAQGVIGGAKGTLTGMWNLATSPLETGKAIGNAIMNYEQTWESAKGAVIEQYGKATSGNPQAMGEVVGGAAFAVVEAIAGTKGVTKLGSMGKAGEAANITGDIARTSKSTGKMANKLTPNSEATGPHTTFKTDASGKVTHHATWEPNPKNPTGFDLKQKTDLTGKPHYNKVTGENVETPHTQGKDIPGGVRTANPEEIPK